MMVDKRVLEMIDACRPGSDDSSDPDLAGITDRIEQDPDVARLYEQVKAFDALAREAMEDVPVPPGLEAQILRALAEASPPSTEQSSRPEGETDDRSEDCDSLHPGKVETQPACSEQVELSSTASGGRMPAGRDRKSHSGRPSLSNSDQPSGNEIAGDASAVESVPHPPGHRRWWMAAALAVAASVFLALGLYLMRPPAEDPLLTEGDFRQLAMKGFEKAIDTEQWPPAGEQVHGWPVSDQMQHQPAGARSIQLSTGEDGLAVTADLYDFRHRGTRAMLFVIHMPAQDARAGVLPFAPKPRPHNTHNLSVEVWQQGEYVYMVVVPGGEEEYFRFVKAEQPQIS